MDPKELGKRGERIAKRLQNARDELTAAQAEADQYAAEVAAFVTGRQAPAKPQHRHQQVTA